MSATKLKHTRLQWAIGQGFFHTGWLSIGNANVNFVYDCGSDNARPLKRAINAYTEFLADHPVNVLFLSHLDFDHVSGLDCLLLQCTVETAILPYLSPSARLILIAQATDQGTIDTSYLSFLSDPTGWLTDRGVTQVIYITPGEPPGEPPNWRELVMDWGPVVPSPDHMDFNVSAFELEFSDSVDENVVRPHRRFHSIARVVSSQKPLRMVSKSPRCVLNWQFIAHVHPEGKREETFRKVVRALFGRALLPNKRFELDQKALTGILRNGEKRDELAGCYSAIRTNRNLTSLSLYSGPISLSGLRVEERSPIYAVGNGESDIAWLGTGDANLRSQPRRKAFNHHFTTVRDSVCTFALPHHGSRHNFHDDLLSYGRTRVVSAGKANKYGHPHAEIRAACSPLWVVTEVPRTEFFERFVVG